MHVIVNVYTEQRYYLTTHATKGNKELTESLALEIMVNPFQQECFPYYVLRISEDVLIEVTEFTGHADMYAKAG